MALYVLDSIVKNVGTPYTVYLGRGLYSTFMEAYVLVDATTRRQMEGMLKTWKEPVPGSMDPRSVFPIETVRPIENALIKAKTAALQNNRQARPPPEYRNTPTPPQHNAQFGPPPGQIQPPHQPYQEYANHQVARPLVPRESPNLSANIFQPWQPTHAAYRPTPPPQHQTYPHVPPAQQTVNDVEQVKRDVAALVSSRQAQFGANPFDQRLQQQLKALLDLQSVLNTKQLLPAELQAIQSQVSVLSGAAAQAQPQPTPQPNVPTPSHWQPPAQGSQPPQYAQPAPPYMQPPSVQPQAHASLLAPGALTGLQALLANGQKPSTPQIRAAAPELQNASHTQLNNIQKQAATAPAMNGSDLIAALSKNGLLSNLPAAKPTPPVTLPAHAQPPPQSTETLLESLRGLLPPPSKTGTPNQLANTSRPRIPMTAASLKTFRPELVHALYDAQPNQCSTCGRRFLATDESRAKKDRHLDWHFRTNQRMADPATNRGQHRDWFVPEVQWISLTEFDPSTEAANASAVVKEQQQQKDPKDQFVRAPPGVTKTTCSICFEEMKSAYSEELQEWVFFNAAVLGGKIVHATCLAEMQKGQQGGSFGAALAGSGQQRQRSATPDSSLGKRKAEGALAGMGMGARMRMD